MTTIVIDCIEEAYFVPGVPAAKGSMRAWIHPNKQNGKLRAMLAPSNSKDLAQWVNIVRMSVSTRWAFGVHRGPVALDITYVMPRPNAHFGTGRNEGVLKGSAPEVPTRKPDIDKLERAIFDALTGTVYHDDAQIVECSHRKRYGEKPGVHIKIKAWSE